jgi:hypothetical protein
MSTLNLTTLKTTNISNSSGSSTITSDNLISGSCKAWVNFNGTGTVAIRASFNVSSITDVGVGDYRINFTNAMSDTNYAITIGWEYRSSNQNSLGFITGTNLTTSVELYSASAGSAYDPTVVCVAIYR